MSPIKVCFLGTPEFARIHLNSLLKNPGFTVAGVVTQPDRPVGRKMLLTPSAVKVFAVENNLAVLTPENLKNEPESLEKIRSWQADVAVVVAFGQILSQEFLDSFRFGAVNVHGSLLPLWRGASPIQRSIEAGDTQTGVSLQKMVRKLDAGPVIGERNLKLNDEITATELYDELSLLGCELLAQELPKFISGEILPREQDENKVSFAVKIQKTESLLTWNRSATEIHNRVRAFTMGPGTYVIHQGKRLKIHKTRVVDKNSTGTPGTIVLLQPDQLHIQTQSGVLSLLELQPESKSKISIADFLKSTVLKKGDVFD